MTSWDEIRGKIKHAHDEIESAYQKYVVATVDKVKERPLLNNAVKTALPLIPVIGPTLSAIYDNIGGGTKSEEDKAKQILDFLNDLEQKNKEQFNRIAQDLQTNRQVITDAINENKIAITDLISKSSTQILQSIDDVQKDTGVILDRVEVIGSRIEKIQTLVEQGRSTTSELKRPPKPSVFRGESTKIFVGRKQDIDTIKNYFAGSNLPVSITGEGGIGKSELAYKAMHECKDMFDLIIPVYFESILTFELFLLEMAKSLNLPIDEFEKKGIEEGREYITNTLATQFKHPLIYADNYETVSRVLRISYESTSASAKEEEKDNAIKINAFLESLPHNTAVLLTSRERYNLDGERPVRLDGLSETEGRDLFIELAKNHFPKEREPSAEIKRALEQISKKAGGHPLSIELLARSYRGEGLSKMKKMLEHMGIGVVNPRKEAERLKSLESCFEYSFETLSQNQRDLLAKLALFSSPFPVDALEKIFGPQESEVSLDLYDRSLLRRIELDYEHIKNNGENEDAICHLYYFHPAIRNYLEHKAVREAKKQDLEQRYGGQFSLYYSKVVKDIYMTVDTKEHALSLEIFNVIWQGKDNDFDRSIRLAKDRLLASFISTYLGLILHALGRYNPALEYHKKALAIDAVLQNVRRMAIDYNNIGAVLFRQGNYDQALEYHKKSLAMNKKLNDQKGIAGAYRNIGLVLKDQGIYDQALEYHKKALEIDKELEDRVRIPRDYANIGLVLKDQGSYDQALDYEKKALALHEEVNDRVGMAIDYANIGLVLDSQGSYDQALDYEKKALALHEEVNDRVRMAEDYANISSVLANMDNHIAAIESSSKALDILQELEENTGYHHPLTDKIQGKISQLQKEKTNGK
jgi:tetratricopeptide (TPR) repeat protein